MLQMKRGLIGDKGTDANMSPCFKHNKGFGPFYFLFCLQGQKDSGGCFFSLKLNDYVFKSK